VTRPVRQAGSICSHIEELGGEVIAFPVIEIVAPGDGSELLQELRDLASADLAIFVSAPAVESVSSMLRQHDLQIPDRVRVAAVGPKTASVCEQESIKVDFVPDDQINSEGLLEELGEMDVQGKTIVIFRGQSGRELIREVLERRGGIVRQVESYQRKITTEPVEPLLEHWRGNDIDVVLLSSVAMVDALVELLGDDNLELLEETTILTFSRRVADYCEDIGILAEVLVARKPSDEATLQALLDWVAD
jgi:uroporphyrinogen-III synthase